MKRLKNILPHLIGNGLILCLLIAAYLYLPVFYQPLDDKIRDFWFQSRGPVEVPGNISIVAIDESSIKALGQWPWERIKLARILHNLDQAGALIIGLDIFFAEQDKTSPHRIAKQLQADIDSLPDYDRILAETIARTPVVLGYLFEMSPVQDQSGKPLNELTATENKQQSRAFIPRAHNSILNLPLLREQAISGGFLNYLPDESGIIRSIPLLISYQDKLYSSMAFELFHLLNDAPPVTINTAEAGITSITLADRQIITDIHGRLQLKFYGPGGSFDYLSAQDIYNGEFDVSKVKGRIILIGPTAAGLKDLRATPFDVAAPGVEVHATALENLLQNDYVFRPDWMPGADISMLLLLALLVILVYPFVPAYVMLLIMSGGLWLLYLFNSQILFRYGFALNVIFPLAGLILFTVSSALINYYLEAGLKKQIKASFAKKVSGAVVDDILKNDKKGALIGRSTEITLLFSDVRSFTRISEQLGSADKIIDLLNIYMTPMVEDIVSSAGTVDKLIGDAIMAYWNAPKPLADHPDLAVASALRQLDRLGGVNEILQQKYQLSIDIGIGINTGTAVVGEMGSAGRSDYTAIGDCVNLASRLEGLCKLYGCRLIISVFTREKLKQDWRMRELDLIRVKGRQEAVRIFEVLGADQQITEEQLLDYHGALTTYQQGEFATALQQFTALSADKPEALYQLYIERCQHYLNQPPESFDGVFTALSK